MQLQTSSACGGIIIDIPRDTTFELPEGNYAATITAIRKFIKQTNRGAQEWIRFLFEVDIPSRSNLINMAGRNFKADFGNGSDLLNFLTVLLGRKFFQAASGRQINLDMLIGMKCELELVHYTNGKYDHPMVMVNGCHKPGTLNLTEKQATPEPAPATEAVKEKGGKVEAK